MTQAKRGDVDPFIVMDVMERARRKEAQGHRVIHMEVGQPSTGAPSAALAALAEDMKAGPLGYTVALGLPELRTRISQHYAQTYNLDIDPARIVITSGASGAFILAFTALFEAGDRVGLGAPCYPSYRQILRALNVDPVALPTRIEDGFQPTPSSLEGSDVTGLILASPANPTGSMISATALLDLSETCKSRGISLISDEIYHGIDYDTRAVSALEVFDDTVVINSFSKYFSMTGWRVGWMVVPPDQVRRIERLAQNMFICPPHASQRLALHAMNNREELDRNVDMYRRNRALLMNELPKIGLSKFSPPDGAFYVYVDVSEYSTDSLAFAADILEHASVAVTPGLDFDPVDGGKWLRLSYARSTDDIKEGIARLGTYLKGLGA